MNEQSLKKFNPVCQLVVYKSDEDFYLQIHEITRQNDRFVLNEGRPFQRDQLIELATALKKQSLNSLRLRDLLSEKVLYFQPHVTGTKFIWYCKPQRQHLKFEGLGHKDGQYLFPGLIFAVSEKRLFIFAFKGSEKPSAKTALYHAPFYNVDANGLVCMGTIADSRRKAYLEEEIERWERRFFGGNFTGAHWSESRLKGATMRQLLEQTKTAKQFPEKHLTQPTKKTLEEFLIKFIERQKDEIED